MSRSTAARAAHHPAGATWSTLRDASCGCGIGELSWEMCTKCGPSQRDPLAGDLPSPIRRSGSAERTATAQQVGVVGQQVDNSATIDRPSPSSAIPSR